MPHRVDRGGSESGVTERLSSIAERARSQYMTIGDMAYSVLREAILSGVLAPGEHLRQDALADSLGISRIPIRSALFQLESDGLIEFRPHRGAVVSMLTVEQMREIYELRIVLESHALRKAIRNMTPQRLRRLESLARTLDREHGDAFVRARIAFYRELYAADDNPLLVSLIERLRSDVGRYWLRRRVVGHEGGHPVHTDLLELARQGDEEGAVQWLAAHLAHVRDELSALLEQANAAEGELPVEPVQNGSRRS
jgi:DNA-binding GntR family transcriptional regulator